MSDLAVRGEIVRSTVLENGEMHVLVKFPVMENPKGLARVCLEGMPVAVVPMNHHPADFGPQARALFRGSFFRAPAVWDYLGTDADYQRWCRSLNECARTQRPGHEGDPIVYAHCRRVMYGAGTGKKPAFRGIPLLNSEHTKQHNHGESAIGGRDWFEQKSLAYVHTWGWETLKRELRYDHWNQVPPNVLYLWAKERGIEGYLPKEYKPAKKDKGEVNG